MVRVVHTSRVGYPGTTELVLAVDAHCELVAVVGLPVNGDRIGQIALGLTAALHLRCTYAALGAGMTRIVRVRQGS
jgi:hypothetical protein